MSLSSLAAAPCRSANKRRSSRGDKTSLPRRKVAFRRSVVLRSAPASEALPSSVGIPTERSQAALFCSQLLLVLLSGVVSLIG